MAYETVRSSSQSLTTATFPVSAVPLTLAFWMYITADDTTLRSPVSVGGLGGNRCGFNISTVNRISLVHIGTSNVTINQTAASAPTLTWIHVCGVFTSLSNREFFLDGVSQGTSTNVITGPGSFTTIAIGARYASSVLGNFTSARFADVGVWNTDLTADEVASLGKGMTCNLIRPQNLKFYAPLIRDLSDVSDGLAITNNNTATVTDHPRVY